MRKPFIKHLQEIPIEQAHGGSGSCQLLLSKDDAIAYPLEAMTKGYLQAGAIFDWHYHDQIDEFFLVTKGSGIIEFEDDTQFEYNEGDMIYVPNNISHKISTGSQQDSEFFFIRIHSQTL